jgi:hypothetical protein
MAGLCVCVKGKGGGGFAGWWKKRRAPPPSPARCQANASLNERAYSSEVWRAIEKSHGAPHTTSSCAAATARRAAATLPSSAGAPPPSMRPPPDPTWAAAAAYAETRAAYAGAWRRGAAIGAALRCAPQRDVRVRWVVEEEVAARAAAPPLRSAAAAAAARGPADARVVRSELLELTTMWAAARLLVVEGVGVRREGVRRGAALFVACGARQGPLDAARWPAQRAGGCGGAGHTGPRGPVLPLEL